MYANRIKDVIFHDHSVLMRQIYSGNFTCHKKCGKAQIKCGK